jgi:hypothetical protein
MGKTKKDVKHNPLMALLPGANIDNDQGKISINVGISSETVISNIGGVQFEIFRSTLLKLDNILYTINTFYFDIDL